MHQKTVYEVWKIMNGLNIFLAVLGGFGTVCAIVFGFLAFRRNDKSDNAEHGRKDGVLLTEVGYIKAGVDRIERRQDKQDEQHIEVVQRLSAVESSAKQAHHRIDRIEGKEHDT